MQQDKQFKPDSKPFKSNRVCSFYKVTDEKDERFFAKIFVQKKLHELCVFQSSEYNQAVLSDLSDQLYPEHFLQIKHTYSIPQGFIFVTDQYQMTLESYLKSKVIEEKECLTIFKQVTKAIYSLYIAGFWHRNIRPEHFVKIGNFWKMESMVFSQQYMDADGLDSEYLWNSAYQPPEAYGKLTFSEEELDEMVVWNCGSLLLDMLLSYHKLKDQSILDRFRNQPFSFRAIGVKKKFSKETDDLLAKMLHHNPEKRMKVGEYFSSQFVCLEVANQQNKNQTKKPRVYSSRQSSLSNTLSMNSQRSQQILTIRGFANEKRKMQETLTLQLAKSNTHKLEKDDELLNKIKRLTKDKLALNNQFNTISEASIEQSSIINRSNRMSDLLLNPRVSKAVQTYKCYYDKCQLLMIAVSKLEMVQYSRHEIEALLLNKFAVTFASLMSLHVLAESMNQNLNFFNLEPQLWSDFQSSNQFRGFKEIMNYRRHERRAQLTPIKERIFMLKRQERDLINKQQIQDFIHSQYKSATFESIKNPYRKILKRTYDMITREYNTKKTFELASIGMYVTYCMTVDKLYIFEDIPNNFRHYFQWMKIAPTSYVAIDQFQDYLDNADRKILVRHSVHILKKYFSVE